MTKQYFTQGYPAFYLASLSQFTQPVPLSIHYHRKRPAVLAGDYLSTHGHQSISKISPAQKIAATTALSGGLHPPSHCHWRQCPMPPILGCLGRGSIPPGWLRQLATVPVSPGSKTISSNNLFSARWFNSSHQRRDFQAANDVADAPRAISWLSQTPQSVVGVVCPRYRFLG